MSVSQLLDEVAEHKRLMQYHRRQAQKKMRELREFCEAAGIEFCVIVPTGDRDQDDHRRKS